jgi:Flp pilus assembly protein TadD
MRVPFFFLAPFFLGGVLWSAPGPQNPGSSASAEGPDQKKNIEEAQAIAKRALASFNKGDFSEARKGFEQVLELTPGNVPTLINLGLVAYRQKKYEDAEASLSKAAKLAPDNGDAWLVLGIVRYESDRFDAALAALAHAAFLAPKSARAHHYLGVTIGKKGWYSGAEEEMRKALELDPSYSEAHYNLALFYLQREPPAIELARRHYHKSVELGAPKDAEIEKRLADSK